LARRVWRRERMVGRKEAERRRKEGDRRRMEGDGRRMEGDRQRMEGDRRRMEGDRRRMEGDRRRKGQKGVAWARHASEIALSSSYAWFVVSSFLNLHIHDNFHLCPKLKELVRLERNFREPLRKPWPSGVTWRSRLRIWRAVLWRRGKPSPDCASSVSWRSSSESRKVRTLGTILTRRPRPRAVTASRFCRMQECKSRTSRSWGNRRRGGQFRPRTFPLSWRCFSGIRL